MRAQRRILVGTGAAAVDRSRTFGALVWLTISVLTRTAWAGGTTLENEATTTVPVREQRRISVNNPRGRTVIVGRADLADVVVKAVKVVRANDQDEAEDWLEELNYRIDSDDNEVLIETVYSERLDEGASFWTFLRGMRYKAQVDYTIEVPMNFEARISSASGDVRVTSLRGDVKATSSSGDIVLRELGRRAFAEVASGDVEVESVEGDVHVRIASGDLLVKNVGGRLDVRASSGDVDVYDVAGNANVEIASGSLLVRGCEGDIQAKAASGGCILSELGGNVSATTASGDITVALMPRRDREYAFTAASGNVRLTFDRGDESGFFLEVTTDHGTIDGDMDIRLDEVTRRVLKGKVGEGNGRLYIETSSGNIRIHQAEALQ